jgi:phenylpropionate dioxygenase-like ring-hydroxylating dioxygenase large terminal subunit
MVPPITDPVLFHDWHPVAESRGLAPGTIHPFRLLGEEGIAWRSADGAVQAWDDRCPHRGSRLSLGRIEGDRVVCAYHGWQFDASGQCRLQPAQPRETPPRTACARRFHAAEAHGLLWVSLGEPARDIPSVPEHTDRGWRVVVGAPERVATCGPRIVENFLDMAHFAFVHAGILGHPDHAEVPDYQVAPFDDGQRARGMRGVIATGCFAYQPNPGLAEVAEGAMVEYSYRVLRPLTAVLTKQAQSVGFPQAISLHVQPLDADSCDAWMVMSGIDDRSTDAELLAKQGRIFAQDLQILESQRPRQVPLEPGVEVPQRADRLSSAYRRMLKEAGLRYGVL